MKIGIDISQLAYANTGVANYLRGLVTNLIKIDQTNEYILFYSSLRRNPDSKFLGELLSSRVTLKRFRFPPTLINMVWNKWHIIPIENLIGNVDVFISSDWVQPPLRKAKGISIIYDLIVYKYPEETHNQTEFSVKKMAISANIVASQKRRLHWVTKECCKILCISKATKKDVQEILHVPEEKLQVIYPGFSL